MPDNPHSAAPTGSSQTGSRPRQYQRVEKGCAAGPDCPYCGGTFVGVKVAKWCCPEARQWKLRRDRKNGHSTLSLVPRWRCPVCGQLAFGDDAPFVCEFCGDAVTWERWGDE